MSGLISSLFEPVVRQARRFSQQSDRPPQPPSDDDQASFLPGALGKSTSPTYNYDGKEGGIMSVHEDPEPRLDSGFTRFGNSPSILPISSLLDPSSRRHETDDSLRPTRNGHGTEDAPTEVSISHSGSPRGFGQNSGPLTPGLAGNTQQSDAATSTQNVVREISPGVPRSEAGNSFDDLDGQFQLPADDGMGVLRRKIHAIRDLGSSSADKARMIHDLMTERYNASRGDYSNEALSPSSPRSPEQPETPPFRWSNQSFDQLLMTPASIASIYQPNNPFNLNFEDLKPTFAPKALEPDSPVGDEEEKDIEEFEDDCLGCQHYKRNVKLQCYTCKRWYTCRFCHDEVEDHHLNRRKTENMLCMLCGHAQAAAQCCQECGKQAAQYYCNVCKLWDNDSEKSIYHCNDCGICRIGQGLGKDFFHCKVKYFEDSQHIYGC
ncbi:hypothetical protein MW887_001727 [Aspergillus wentii]|nr:hypothetical protein MW887_001727 [Aspergillus wentii]